MRARLGSGVLVALLCGTAAPGQTVLPGALPPVEANTPAAGALRPSLNLYGVPGAMDTPSAFAMDEGDFTVSANRVGPVTHGTLTFQALPWLSGSFRYTSVEDLNLDARGDYFDRSFDLRFRLLEERRYLPEVTVGLQDFAGTGVYSSEYVVASKRLGPRVSASAGLGWGRLGTDGSIFETGERPRRDIGLGGTAQFDTFFRGPAAPFASVEWLATDRLRLKAEYSGDAYVLEERQGVYERNSPLSFGVEYQASPSITLAGYRMHDGELGAGVRVRLNPRRGAPSGFIDPAPPPVPRRIDPREAPQLYGTSWADLPQARETLGERLREALAEEGIRVEGFEIVSGREVILRIADPGVGVPAQTVGRVARVMARELPYSAEIFRIVPQNDGSPLSQIVLRRSDLEGTVTAPDGTERLAGAIAVTDAPRARAPGDPVADEIYPRFGYAIGPYVRASYFDPDSPVRLEYGARLTLSAEPAPGFALGALIAAPLGGNINDEELSESLLPRVRTDARLYGDDEPVVLERLTLAHYGRPGPNLYSRVTAGYLERAFGGVSGELLYKPPESRFAVGAEVNRTRKRDYDLGLGFQDYEVTTGHLSVYADLPGGFLGQIDLGRYLAGDVGGTLTLTREFANGWRVGAFATVTDASAEEFGEGSFDKGIIVSIPLRAEIGTVSSTTVGRTIRPIQRDGGARLRVPGRLYERVRAFDGPSIERSSGRILR